MASPYLLGGRLAVLACMIVLSMPGAAFAFDGRAVLADLSAALHREYPDPAAALHAADALEAQASALAMNTDRAAFAQAVTAVMFSATQDKHLRLLAEPEALPETQSTPDTAATMEKGRNYGIATVGILPGNIGYLALSGLRALHASSGGTLRLGFRSSCGHLRPRHRCHA